MIPIAATWNSIWPPLSTSENNVFLIPAPTCPRIPPRLPFTSSFIRPQKEKSPMPPPCCPITSFRNCCIPSISCVIPSSSAPRDNSSSGSPMPEELPDMSVPAAQAAPAPSPDAQAAPAPSPDAQAVPAPSPDAQTAPAPAPDSSADKARTARPFFSHFPILFIAKMSPMSQKAPEV